MKLDKQMLKKNFFFFGLKGIHFVGCKPHGLSKKNPQQHLNSPSPPLSPHSSLQPVISNNVFVFFTLQDFSVLDHWIGLTNAAIVYSLI